MRRLHREMEQANKSGTDEVAPECCCAKRSTATVAQGDGLSANDLFPLPLNPWSVVTVR